MADTLSNLVKPAGSTKKKLRKGRGVGSGLGKTAGRGQKGQYARGSVKDYFEGGQTPLQRRLPKRGFTNKNKAIIAEVNVSQLEVYAAGAKVDETSLRDHGIIKGAFDRLKILGNGELTKSLTITADTFSRTAEAKITKAGGKALLVIAATVAS